MTVPIELVGWLVGLLVCMSVIQIRVSWIINHTVHRHTQLVETSLCLINHKATQAQGGVLL